MKSFSDFVSENAASMNPQAKLAAEVQAAKQKKLAQKDLLNKLSVKVDKIDPTRHIKSPRGTGSSGNQ